MGLVRCRTWSTAVLAAALVVVPAAPGGAATAPTPPVTTPVARAAPPAPAPSPTAAPTPRPPVRTYVHRVSTRDRVVFLTIDDGYTRDPAFLALMRREHLPVTIFNTDSVLSGAGAVAYFRALKAEGAVIENHTLSHPYLTRVGSAQRTRQICGAQSVDRRVFGATPTLMRPPYGAWNKAVIDAAIRCGIHAVVGWDAVMGQSGGLKTWFGRPVLYPGDIIIMHFRPGLALQVQKLERLVRSQHLRFALLERYL